MFEQRQGGGTVLRLGVPSIEQVEIGKKWPPFLMYLETSAGMDPDRSYICFRQVQGLDGFRDYGAISAKVEWKVSAVQEAGFIENPWQVVFKRVIRRFSINCCALLTVKTVN